MSRRIAVTTGLRTAAPPHRGAVRARAGRRGPVVSAPRRPGAGRLSPQRRRATLAPSSSPVLRRGFALPDEGRGRWPVAWVTFEVEWADVVRAADIRQDPIHTAYAWLRHEQSDRDRRRRGPGRAQPGGRRAGAATSPGPAGRRPRHVAGVAQPAAARR